MTSLYALIKREYLEHRGAFLYAPVVILGILLLTAVSGFAFNRFQARGNIELLPALKVFEVGLLALSMLWFFYLLVALFFYYADAFSADGRNNSMLFWKSMPQSDFRILMSKMLAGMTLFPALIFGAVILTGIMLYGSTVAWTLLQPGLALASPFAFLTSAGQVLGIGVVFLVVGLFWYAPLFAWVGLLSTLFRRWSIPLAFLIPGLAGLAENLLFRDSGAPMGGHLLSYLNGRLHFVEGNEEIVRLLFAGPQLDGGAMLAELMAQVDWPQLAGGVIVAVLLVYVASEYRRRAIAG